MAAKRKCSRETRRLRRSARTILGAENSVLLVAALLEYRERVQEAAARYEERPIDASDWPDSWQRLHDLLTAAKGES